MFQSPGMQSLMQQMMENPQLMSSMINAPYTQAMFQVWRSCLLLLLMFSLLILFMVQGLIYFCVFLLKMETFGVSCF